MKLKILMPQGNWTVFYFFNYSIGNEKLFYNIFEVTTFIFLIIQKEHTN